MDARRQNAVMAGAALLALVIGLWLCRDSIYTLERPKMQTVRDLIFSGTIEEKKWYWIDSASINIGNDLMVPRFPLSETAKALVVTPKHYLTTTYGLHTSWEGITFRKFENGKKTFYALSHKIFISHWGRKISLDDEQRQKMHIDSLEPGIHFFAQYKSGSFTQLSVGEVAFLKRYYRIQVKLGLNGERTEISEVVRPIIGKYVIYDYYPTGDMKQRTMIMEDGIMAPQEPGKYFDVHAEDRDKWLRYEVRVRSFNPEGQKQTTPRDEIITELTDKSHRFWLQNILHDYEPPAQQ